MTAAAYRHGVFLTTEVPWYDDRITVPMDMPQPAKTGSALDTIIKILVILKLLVQLAFYGVLLGATLWFLLDNPIPELLSQAQDQALKSIMQGGAGR
jgi:hypothetical protein